MNKGVKMMIAKRKELNLTQQELADNLKVITRSNIAMLEANRINPSIKTAKAIAEYLGFNWTLFFEEE